MSGGSQPDRPEAPQASITILLVDDHEQRAEALERVLRKSGYGKVIRAASEQDLPACVRQTQPDVILIDVDSPSRDTLDQIHAVHLEAPRPIVMFTQEQDRAVIERAVRSGVSAYVVDGIGSKRVQPIIDAAIATFNEFQALRCELEQTKTSLSDRKTIDRAKGILMAQRNLPEGAAYKMMQKLAMDRKRRIADVARDVIEMADLFGKTTA